MLCPKQQGKLVCLKGTKTFLENFSRGTRLQTDNQYNEKHEREKSRNLKSLSMLGSGSSILP